MAQLHHAPWLRRVHLVDGAHLERLQRLGLTSYEARAYLALLRRDSSTAAEAARHRGPAAPAHLRRAREPGREGPRVDAARPCGQVRGRGAGAGARAARRPAPAASSQELERDAAHDRASSRPRSMRARSTPTRSSTSRCCATGARSTSASPSSQAGIKRRDPRLHEAAVRDAAAGEREGPRGHASTHRARSVYEFSVFDDPALRRTACGASSRPARKRASSRSCRSSS